MGIVRVTYRGRKWIVETDKEAIVGRCEIGLDTIIKLTEYNDVHLEIKERAKLDYKDIEKMVDKCAEVKIEFGVTLEINGVNASVSILVDVDSEDVAVDSTMIKLIQQDTRIERDVHYILNSNGSRIEIRSKRTIYRRQVHGKSHAVTKLSGESIPINEEVKLQDGDKYIESILDNIYVIKDHR